MYGDMTPSVFLRCVQYPWSNLKCACTLCVFPLEPAKPEGHINDDDEDKLDNKLRFTQVHTSSSSDKDVVVMGHIYLPILTSLYCVSALINEILKTDNLKLMMMAVMMMMMMTVMMMVMVTISMNGVMMIM